MAIRRKRLPKVLKAESLTEKVVQNIMYSDYHFQKKYEILIPNCFILPKNEADMFGIRSSGLSDEFEIKLTKADFKNDAKKMIGRYTKYDALVKGKLPCNYFWYVIPEGLLPDEDIPPWAGIIHIAHRRTKIVRNPKRLHTNKLTDEFKYKTARKAVYRYWDLRLKETK